MPSTRPSDSASAPIFTVGHSTREIAEFLTLLEEHSVEEVIDVRKIPGSNRFPHFHADALDTSLAERRIAFRRIDALTGRRPVSKVVPFEVNGWWQNRSFHNYADHALSGEFRGALEEVADIGRRIAIMCSEAVWWRCHRRIIADHLLANGCDVRHILGPGRADAAKLSVGASADSDGRVTYPAHA